MVVVVLMLVFVFVRMGAAAASFRRRKLILDLACRRQQILHTAAIIKSACISEIISRLSHIFLYSGNTDSGRLSHLNCLERSFPAV